MNNDGIPDHYEVGFAAADNGDDDTAYDVDIAGSGHFSFQDLLLNSFIESFDKPDD